MSVGRKNADGHFCFVDRIDKPVSAVNTSGKKFPSVGMLKSLHLSPTRERMRLQLADKEINAPFQSGICVSLNIESSPVGVNNSEHNKSKP